MVSAVNIMAWQCTYINTGWIETLLEESYNERMHLLTFLKMAEPGWFMRVMVLG